MIEQMEVNIECDSFVGSDTQLTQHRDALAHFINTQLAQDLAALIGSVGHLPEQLGELELDLGETQWQHIEAHIGQGVLIGVQQFLGKISQADDHNYTYEQSKAQATTASQVADEDSKTDLAEPTSDSLALSNYWWWLLDDNPSASTSITSDMASVSQPLSSWLSGLAASELLQFKQQLQLRLPQARYQHKLLETLNWQDVWRLLSLLFDYHPVWLSEQFDKICIHYGLQQQVQGFALFCQLLRHNILAKVMDKTVITQASELELQRSSHDESGLPERLLWLLNESNKQSTEAIGFDIKTLELATCLDDISAEQRSVWRQTLAVKFKTSTWRQKWFACLHHDDICLLLAEVFGCQLDWLRQTVDLFTRQYACASQSQQWELLYQLLLHKTLATVIEQGFEPSDTQQQLEQSSINRSGVEQSSINRSGIEQSRVDQNSIEQLESIAKQWQYLVNLTKNIQHLLEQLLGLLLQQKQPQPSGKSDDVLTEIHTIQNQLIALVEQLSKALSQALLQQSMDTQSQTPQQGTHPLVEEFYQHDHTVNRYCQSLLQQLVLPTVQADTYLPKQALHLSQWQQNLTWMTQLTTTLQLCISCLTSTEQFTTQVNWHLNQMQGQAKQRAQLKQLLMGLHASVNRLALLPDVEQSASTSAVPMQELTVIAAGIVILGPYLLRFFAQLDYLDKPTLDAEAFKSPQQARRGVQLLHYLLFETLFEPQPDNSSLALLNLVCGLPTSCLPLTDITINDKEQHHCELLLKALSQHWPGMAEETVRSLRLRFLSRSGQLMLVDTEQGNGQNWRCIPQPQPQDVMLKTLPWAIGTLKLPWMPQPLVIDWSPYD